MSRLGRYERDRRVRKEGKGYTVTVDGREYRVLHTDAFAWGIYTGPNLDLVGDGRGGFAHGYRGAEAAIDALIGHR
ncbi:hypothetical protein JQS43_24340 [Natronosporangium hydrolyticum]|uniref:Uncharacterized protein n=1 Tax=Natronosporangium hydrolyticum TaxID=2811111 RepID=A0A895YEI8_9ACTN|nr:hypothetical protein [Natronosporangium hydrolyticum]QSB14565.1 hypothetical protein JQS43_24340 [Natronosporangium hydrolyticum]